MKTDKLVDQLELYSNAIVAFMVAQSIAFSFTLGTNADFACAITRYKVLSAALIAHFVFTTGLAALALRFLRRRIAALAKETESPLSQLGEDTLRLTYLTKGVAVVLFALIPVGLLTFFGLLGEPAPGRCVKPTEAQKVLATPVRPNPSLKPSANGRPPGPVRGAVHSPQPGPGVLPLAPA